MLLYKAKKGKMKKIDNIFAIFVKFSTMNPLFFSVFFSKCFAVNGLLYIINYNYILLIVIIYYSKSVNFASEHNFTWKFLLENLEFFYFLQLVSAPFLASKPTFCAKK